MQENESGLRESVGRMRLIRMDLLAHRFARHPVTVWFIELNRLRVRYKARTRKALSRFGRIDPAAHEPDAAPNLKETIA